MYCLNPPLSEPPEGNGTEIYFFFSFLYIYIWHFKVFNSFIAHLNSSEHIFYFPIKYNLEFILKQMLISLKNLTLTQFKNKKNIPPPPKRLFANRNKAELFSQVNIIISKLLLYEHML